MTTVDEPVIHQLLGRLTHFHALFIEPSLHRGDRAAAQPNLAVGPRLTGPCCNHRVPSAMRPTVAHRLTPTAWNVLDELGEAARTPIDPACHPRGGCCAVCRVLLSGATLISTWITVECDAYQMSHLDDDARSTWTLTAGTRLAAAFATQHQASCSRFDDVAGCLVAPVTNRARLVALPLTAELLTLWNDPASISKQPVTSWLNHCTGLADVARQRSDRSRP